MKKLLLKCMVVLLFLAAQAQAQNRTITGTVTGKDDGSPIPGVSIVVKGTKTGTQTNSAGKFTLSVGPGQQILVVSFIGYVTQSVPVTSSNMAIVLDPSSKALTEVMVVGYGTQTVKENVGSVAQIKGADLVEQPVQSFEQSLAGKAAGVQITIANSVLNTPPVFHIRGTNSISLSSQPLIVVDGVVSFSGDFSGGESGGNALANINPDDIESIDVLKDASATAIYGSRGGNGVVIVTTKKGKKGSSVVSVDSWIGVTKVNRLPTVLNANQYVAEKNEAIVNDGINPANEYAAIATDANGNPIDFNWQNLVYRTGTSYNTTASISGGTDNTQYYFSANYSKQAGVIVKNNFSTQGILFNIDHKLGKYISMGAKISYADQMNLAATSSGSLSGEAYATAGLGRIALLLPPNLAPFNNDGSYNLNGTALGTMADKGITISYPNPQVAIDLDRANNEINHLASNVYFAVTPAPWVTLKTSYGLDNIYSTNDAFYDPIDNSPAQGIDTYLQSKRWVWDNTAQFSYTLASKHNLSLLLGNEQQQSTQYGFGISRTVLSDPAFNQIQSGYTTNATSGLTNTTNYLVSFFGNFKYDFDKKYLISATLRKDGYSGFGPNSKYGYFPGVGLGWEVAKEKFWADMGADKLFSTFKLKASWGRVGNNGVSDYASYGFYSTGLYNGNATLAPSQTGNNSLAWETSSQTDVGLDMGLFNDRITVNMDYYKNNISGLIFNVPEAVSAGLPTQPAVNIGSMYNQGFEFNVDADIVRKKDFKWTANFNISYNANKITSLIPGTNFFTYSTSSLEIANINQVGYPVGDLYIVRSAGVDPATGQRIFINGAGKEVLYNFVGNKYTYTDGSAAPAITQASDAINYSNAVPKEVGGITNDFHYKNFDLNVLLTYQLGFDVYYGTQATLTDQRFWNNSTVILDHWTTPGQIAAYPKVVFGDNVSNGTSFPTDFNTYNGDFLKVKTVNLGYTLPKGLLKSIGISSVRVYVTGQNLLIFTKYPGPDPEVGSNGTNNSAPGVDRNTVANGRTFTAGFSVKF